MNMIRFVSLLFDLSNLTWSEINRSKVLGVGELN